MVENSSFQLSACALASIFAFASKLSSCIRRRDDPAMRMVWTPHPKSLSFIVNSPRSGEDFGWILIGFDDQIQPSRPLLRPRLFSKIWDGEGETLIRTHKPSIISSLCLDADARVFWFWGALRPAYTYHIHRYSLGLYPAMPTFTTTSRAQSRFRTVRGSQQTQNFKCRNTAAASSLQVSFILSYILGLFRSRVHLFIPSLSLSVQSFEQSPIPYSSWNLF